MGRYLPHPLRADAVVVLFRRPAPLPKGCVGDREYVAVSLPRLRCLEMPVIGGQAVSS